MSLKPYLKERTADVDVLVQLLWIATRDLSRLVTMALLLAALAALKAIALGADLVLLPVRVMTPALEHAWRITPKPMRLFGPIHKECCRQPFTSPALPVTGVQDSSKG